MRVQGWVRIIGLWLWAWALLGALPQPRGGFTFRTFGVEEGLSSASVTTVAVDRENTVWVGTEDGLFVLKGRRFTHLGKSEGLADPWVYDLITPSTGGVWVYTQTALQFWDGERFQNPQQRGLPASIGSPRVFGMEQKVFLYLLEDRIFLVGHGQAPELLEGVRVRDVQAACLSRMGQGVWFLKSKGIARWQSGRLEAARAIPSALRSQGRVLEMLQGPDGGFFFRTRKALLRLGADFKTVEVLAQGLDQPLGNGALRLDPQGTVWTQGIGGLLAWRNGALQFLGASQGLQTESAIFGFSLDQDGGLWIGSDQIHHLRGHGVAELHTRLQGMPSPFVQGIIRDRAGTLWALTRSGMARADGARWKSGDGLPDAAILTCLERPDGEILFAGESREEPEPCLWSLPAGAKVPRRLPLYGVDASLDVFGLAGDQAHLWVATKSDGLLWGRREMAGWRMQSVAVPGFEAVDGVVPRMTSVLVDRMGGLWVCGEAGLARWDGRAWQRFGKAEGLPEKGYFTLRQAPDGRLWVSAIRDRKLVVLGVEGGRWRPLECFDQAHPLARDPIYAVAFEPDGTLVLGTGRGVKFWKDGQLRWFASEWGLGAADCSQNGLYRDLDGSWWVGTSSGLVHLDGVQIRRQQAVSGVRILEVLGKDGNALHLPPPGQALRLPSAHSAFTIAIVPRSLLGSAGCTMEYRMLGFEQEWKAEDDLQIGFGGLSPGTYTYEVRLRRWDGALGPTTQLRFEVPRPWYGTGWFRTLVLLLLGCGVYLLLRWRTRRLEAANTRLEAEVAVRTQELEAQAAELSQTNGELRDLTDQLIEAMGEIRTLRGFIPICSYCKKIRNDTGYWDQLEQYIGVHTDAKLSHGVCPDCAANLRKEWGLD